MNVTNRRDIRMPIDNFSLHLHQLKDLLAIYHGKQITDLNTEVTVDSSRAKGIYRKYLPFFGASNIVTQLESLAKEIEWSGVGAYDVIPATYHSRLLNLVRSGERERVGSATQLLCSRISTIMRADMKEKVIISKQQLQILSFYCAAATLLRVSMNFYPSATLLLSLSAFCVALKCYKDPTNDELASYLCHDKELNDNHPVTKKCREYAKKLA
jgi:hypothetical protein